MFGEFVFFYLTTISARGSFALSIFRWGGKMGRVQKRAAMRGALCGIVATSAVFLAIPGQAAVADFPEVVVHGTWSDPVLSGTVIDGATGTPTVTDNTSSAACNISGCPNGVGFTVGPTTLSWGVSPEASDLTINGHGLTDVALNTPFDAVGLTFFNGSSLTTSIIFGATLNLTFTDFSGNPIADPLRIPIQIVTTANTGNAAQNADWVGPFGTSTPMTMNVFEEANGQAELFGEFVEDPKFQPTLLLSTDPNTFIGNGQPIAAPEPSTWALMLLGFCSVGLVLRSRQSQVRPA
jgi:hypothetical protein